MKILLNKKATAALALCLSVSMATQGANTAQWKSTGDVFFVS